MQQLPRARVGAAAARSCCSSWQCPAPRCCRHRRCGIARSSLSGQQAAVAAAPDGDSASLPPPPPQYLRQEQQEQQQLLQHQDTPLQQHDNDHSLWRQLQLRPLAGGLLLAAALALGGSGRSTAAVAATLSDWPITTAAADSGVSSSSSSSAAPGTPAAPFPGSSAGSSSGSSPAAAAAAAAADDGDDGLLPHERAAVALFAAACPSVVNVAHLRSMQNFYTLDVHRMAVGQGSGFIWDNAGHVITNYHVIKGAAEVKVTLFDHSSCTARVVGADAAKDIAVLKLALPRGRLEALQPVTLGSSSGLRVGQAVYAIGNPYGLDHTLTQGVVSGLGRELSTGLSAIKGVIQSDAAINAGNSGGVLLNSKGAVIGVNLGILDPSGKGAFSGVGFAVPIDMVKGLVSQILTHGRVRRPSLGVTLAPEQVLAQLGAEGVLVLEVPAGTPAAAAGLRPTYRDVFGDLVIGDIIVGMDTRPIRRLADLLAALDERRPGDKVRCDVLRDGKRLSMTVTLGERGLGSCE